MGPNDTVHILKASEGAVNDIKYMCPNKAHVHKQKHGPIRNDNKQKKQTHIPGAQGKQPQS